MNILEEVQIYVADRLNADSQLSGLCPFIFENKKDIDYEIKSALGKQGIIGLVMTPKATFAGAFEDKSLAWQVDELEVDIIENVTVNRGKKNGYVTGQDAAMRLFEVMCPLSGDNEGQFNAVSYEEGEDNNLLVNKCILKCLVHSVPLPDTTTKVKYTEESGLAPQRIQIDGALGFYSIPDISAVSEIIVGSPVTSISAYTFWHNTNLENVTLPDGLSSIGYSSFVGCPRLTSIAIPGSVVDVDEYAFNECTNLATVELGDGMTSIGYGMFEKCGISSIVIPDSISTVLGMAFYNCSSLTNVTIGSGVNNIGMYAFTGDTALEEVVFRGKTLYEISGMANYPWGIANTQNIHNIIGPNTRVKYGWSQSWDSLPLSGTLNSDDLPSRDGIRYVGIGSSIDEIGYRAFRGMEFLTGVEIPDTITTIGTEAFSGAEGMTNIEIPSSVTSIGSNAFFGCHSL